MERFGEKFISSEESDNKMEKKQKYLIPENEVSEFFACSSGKGGQNVNKVSTKAGVRWNVDSSAKFSEEQKEKIKKFLGNRITREGDLIATSQEERSQLQNRKRAFEKLNSWVELALIPEKERKPTKPTLASRERRLEEKQRQSEKKKWRREKF